MTAASTRRTRAYLPYLLPGGALFLVVIAVPLVWNVVLSFVSWRGIRPPRFVGADNWVQLAGDSRFWLSFGNSVAMIVAMVVLPTAIGLVLAALLFDVVGRRFGGKVASFLRATYYLPQILPVVIAAIVVGWIVRPDGGALNTVLTEIGLGALAQNWLGGPDTAMPTIMAVLVWVQIGYPVVIFMAALGRVDPALFEAAEIDGAGWWQRLRAITVPAIRPEFFVVTLTCTIAALKVFAPVFALTKGGPGDATVVPAYYAYVAFFQKQQVGYGAAVATALTAVVLVVSVLFVWAQARAERAEEE